MANIKSDISEATKVSNSENKTKDGPLLIINDYVFKRIFSIKNILASFLTAYLCFEIKESEIEIENPLNGPLKKNDKINLPDLKVTIKINSDVLGKFDIEMQTTCHEFIWEKFQYALCKEYVDQLSRGRDYSELNRAFVLVIYSVNAIKDEACYHRLKLYDSENNFEYPRSNEIHILEIPKRDQLLLNKSQEDKEKFKLLFKWLQFFASKTEEEYMQAAQGNAAMEAAYDRIKVMSMDKDERAIADAVEIAIGNEIAQFKSGVKKGHEEKDIAYVTNMLKKNMSTDEIIELSGLTEKRINEIKATLQ